ncbi:MAG TPA: class I SAM-dependent methyltransferase [Terracidiphilus sp.]|nr:class I SAM-dependent methyltransferase [Terracidiphilus sp.]
MSIGNAIKSVGVRIYEEFFAHDEFDKAHNTETTRTVHRRRLRVGNSAQSYFATQPEFFKRACSYLPEEAKNYRFFDLGSGKGRVLIMAHEHGFQHVAGVELSQSLIAICKRNLAKLGITDVEVYAEDASVIQLPDEPLVIFMYNPFKPPIFNKVVDHLIKHTRPVYLVYVTPMYKRVIQETGHFTPIVELPYLAVYKNPACPVPNEVCASIQN